MTCKVKGNEGWYNTSRSDGKNDGSSSKPDSRAPSVLLKMITEHVDRIDMILMALRSGGCVANGLSSYIKSYLQRHKLESLLLHYTNRAVKRVSIGKTRKALDDCRMATYLDTGFTEPSFDVVLKLVFECYFHTLMLYMYPDLHGFQMQCESAAWNVRARCSTDYTGDANGVGVYGKWHGNET
ncbi:hypothetical protein Tco_1101446 [Tanacetum coccineum]